MSTQLLSGSLGSRHTVFQMIECPSDAAAILNLVEREKPQVVVISAKMGEDHAGGDRFASRASSAGFFTLPRVIMLLDSSERAAVIEEELSARAPRGVFCPDRALPFAGQVHSVAWNKVKSGPAVPNCSSWLEALTQPALAHLNSNGGSLPFRPRN